jgi:hypothetical protein
VRTGSKKRESLTFETEGATWLPHFLSPKNSVMFPVVLGLDLDP